MKCSLGEITIHISKLMFRFPPFFDDHPFGIYEKILSGKIQFPSHFDPHAKDLVKKLLAGDRTKRIGNLKNGADDIKKHKWFKGMNWNAVLARTIDAPIVPEFKGPGDTANFETYPEVDIAEETKVTGVDPYKALFKEF